jgi:hypothetical protein
VRKAEGMLTDLMDMTWRERAKKAPTINNESSQLSAVMLYFIAIIPLLMKRPVLVISQTQDFLKF